MDVSRSVTLFPVCYVLIAAQCALPENQGIFCILVFPEGGKQTFLTIHHLSIIAWGAQWSPEARDMGACSVSLLAWGTFLSPPKPVCFPTPPYTHFWASNVYGDSQVSTFLTKPFGSAHDS